MTIDLRSDTVTQPTRGMLEAISQAAVGDDVFGEDPSVNALEKKLSELFGMEAALYCPTGTMSNQIAIKCHTQPGDEVICEQQAHVYIYEGGGIAFNSGSQARTIVGDQGRITAEQIGEKINPDDVHRPRTSLVCLENTSNRGGGRCYAFSEISKISHLCRERNLQLHLDGARLFNALVAKNESPLDYGLAFNSISVCLNKGLGCPMGSVLMGKAAFIRQARRIRKLLGGGMRQAGYMAAAGIYALDEHVTRLAIDHEHAGAIAGHIRDLRFVEQVFPAETNIVIFETKQSFPAAAIVSSLKAKGILSIAIAPYQVRLVTHLGITDEMTETTIAALRSL